MSPEFCYSLFRGKTDLVELAATLSVINDLTRASRWTSKQFLEALQQEQLYTFIAKEKAGVVAYSIFSLAPPEAHLVNIAVAPKFQRQGVGQSFLEFALDFLSKSKVTECWLEVRESNFKAMNLYKKCGFKHVQIRKDFYEAPKEDGWLMMKNLA